MSRSFTANPQTPETSYIFQLPDERDFQGGLLGSPYLKG
jgi:hypothetical protein